MNTHHRSAAVSLTLVALMLTTPLVGLAGATSGGVTAVIASPANGSTHTRIGNVVFSEGSTHSSCAITSWAWTFGDGATSSVQNPSHRYTALGSYAVTLDVTGACGATSQASISVIVENIVPIAAISATPLPATAGAALTLTPSSSRDLDGTIAEYRYSLNGVAFPPQASAALPTTAPTSVGTHTASLVIVDNEGAMSPAATLNFQVVHAALHRIDVSGPAGMIVGTTASFAPTGVDAYENPVPLAVATFSFTAPTTPGTASASYTESGVTGSKLVTVTTDQLFRIEVDGPSTLVAATSGSYALAGFDQYDNPVALDQSSLVYTAPTAAGVAMVCYSQSSVSGCQTISVVADALASITVSGAASLVAGQTGTYALAGFDQYGNNVVLAQGSVGFSRTTTGPATVSYTEGGHTGSLGITIVPDALDSITLTGPTTLVVGDSATYGLFGWDQYNNAVALAQSSRGYTAPTVSGVYTVNHTESGVTGTLSVNVVSDQLFTMYVDGPAFPIAGTSILYVFTGIDEHGNPVTLDPQERVFAIPTLVGTYDLCEEQQGVYGCITIDVQPAPLHTIVLSGPSTLVAGHSTSYALDGFDVYGNDVTLAQTSLAYTASTTAGSYTASYTEGGITGTHAVTVVADAVDRLELTGPLYPVAGTTNSYAVDGFDQHGNTVAAASTVLNIVAPTLAGPATFSHTYEGVTGTLDVTIVHAALASIQLDGPTTVVAGTETVSGLFGYDQYANPVALAQTTLTSAVPTAVGPHSFSYTEGSVTGVLHVNVIADELDVIVVSGPATLVAGTSANYDLAGYDQYGNAVALAQATLPVTAPTSVGPMVVSYQEMSVLGSKNVQVVADALATITVTGPDTMVAGETADFDLAGADQYGNSVPLAATSLSHTAPVAAGADTVEYTESGVTGTKAITVVAAALFEIVVTGPASLVAGTTGSYHADGRDTHGNSVVLPEPDFTYDAPLAVGTLDVCTTQLGVTGCQEDVEIVADALHHIYVTGPTTMVAGHGATYTFAGYDQYENAVTLATMNGYFVDTTIPSATFSYTEGGITGSIDVTVVADALDTVVVSGPATLVAGTTGAYSLAGSDQWGNPVGLAQATLSYTASTTAGPATVSYTESNVTGTQAITVVHDALASLLLTGPSSVAAGSVTSYAVSGFDQYGNAVPTAAASVDHMAPTSLGEDTVSYTEGGVTGTKLVQVVSAALARIAVGGPDDMVAGSTATFNLAGFDAHDNPVALPQSSLSYTAPTTVGQYAVTYTHAGVTGSRPVEVVSGLPHYILVEGPATLVAGTTGEYALSGFDVYNNAVELDEETLSYTASTTTGTAQVCYVESGVEGCATVSVVNAPLASILVSGPDPIVAGATETYEADGFDTYGNAVDLGSATPFSYTAPTTAGGATVSLTVDGVTGFQHVAVIAGTLASIEVGGAASQVAGTTVSFPVAGFDQHGNGVTLDVATISRSAPTTVGSYVVSYTEDGVTGSKSVTVTPDTLSTITLSGPASLAAGTSATYGIAGYDQYGNAVVTSPASRAFTAPTTAGATQFCETQEGVSGCIDVTIGPDALASILVLAPSPMTAGSVHTVGLEGYDQYGNEVALSTETLVYEAPEEVGIVTISHTESGITGSVDVEIIAAPLDSIVVSGPATMAAGSTATYGLAGYDAFGNHVALAQSELAFTAPTAVGPATAAYTEGDVEGSLDITIVAAALDTIEVTGPTTLVAGTSADYALAGFDQYGNDVTLAQSSATFTAPELAGTTTFSYEESGIVGEILVTVVADALASIVVDAPTTLVAGSTNDIPVFGFDQFGNAATLDTTSIAFVAPQAVGIATVTYEEEGVVGSADVEVVPDVLVRIDVAGPSSVVAGQSATYTLAGVDQFENAVALAQATTTFSSTVAGPASVVYEELGVIGSLGIVVLPDAVVAITVTGPATVNAGVTATFAVSAVDQFGNAAPLAVASIAWTAPLTPQLAQACYTEAGVTGCTDVEVTIGPVARISVVASTTLINANRNVTLVATPFDAAGNVVPDVVIAWTTTRGTVTSAGLFSSAVGGVARINASAHGVTGTINVTVTTTLLVSVDVDTDNDLGAPVVGTVNVSWIDGTRVEGAVITVYVEHSVSGLGLGGVRRAEMHGSTNANGTFVFETSTAWSLPSNYELTALATRRGNTGSAYEEYSV